MNAQRLLALIAFLITGWIIASLAFSGDVVRGTAPLSVGPILQVLAATSADIVLTIGIVLLSVVFYWLVRDRKLLAEAVRNLFSRRKGKNTERPNRNLTRDIIGIFLLFGILILFRSSRTLLSPQPPKGSTTPGGFSLFIISGFDGQTLQSSLLAAYHFFAVWAFQIAFMAIMVLCLVIFLRAMAQLRSNEPVLLQYDSTVAEETIGVLRKGTKDLQMGDDHRTSILVCYRRLCEIFEPKETMAHRLLTARELREHMVKQFRLAEQPISLLTELFEEARYSSHQISIEMKDRAIKALGEIESYLRAPSEGTFEAIQ